MWWNLWFHLFLHWRGKKRNNKCPQFPQLLIVMFLTMIASERNVLHLEEKKHTKLPNKQKAFDLKGHLNQQSTLATGGWVAERLKTYVDLDLLLPVTWKLSMPRGNNNPWLFWELLAASSAAPAKRQQQRHWRSLRSESCPGEGRQRAHH